MVSEHGPRQLWERRKIVFAETAVVKRRHNSFWREKRWDASSIVAGDFPSLLSYSSRDHLLERETCL
jgi:hypothetical protein